MQASGCSAGLEVLLIAGVSAHPQQAAAGTLQPKMLLYGDEIGPRPLWNCFQ